MNANEFTYLLLMMVITVDTLGINFSIPILVPFGQSIGASLQVIGLGATLRFAMNNISLLWMPICADKFGRRILIAMSVGGSGISYFMQGASSFAGKVPMWIGGRMVAGFFGGTAPVVGAFLMDISMPDVALMKKRMVMLQVTQTSFGIMLGPICGALANFSLELPYYVSAGAAAFVLVLVVLFLRDAKSFYATAKEEKKEEEKKEEDVGMANKRASQVRRLSKVEEKKKVVEEEAEEEKEKPEGKPWKDPVLLLLFVGSCFILNFIMGNVLLIPKIMEKESFGLRGKDNKETQKKIAAAMGIVGLPGGLASVAASALLYVPLTNKFGDVPVMGGGCGMGMLASLGFAFLPKKLWHIAVLNLFLGLGFGVATPAIGPTVARHVGHHYKRQAAVANSIPMFGASLAGLFSQLLMATIYEEFSLEAAWVFGVFCVGVFAVVYFLAHRIILARLPPEEISKQKKAEQKLGSIDSDKFIEAMVEEVKYLLEHNKVNFWNPQIQNAVSKKLMASCKIDVRNWDDKTDGLEYLQDLFYYLQESPEELAKFRKDYPHICQKPGEEAIFLSTHCSMSV